MSSTSRIGLRRSFAGLFRPLLAPRRGFVDFLQQGDLVSFPLFSALLGYFAAALIYLVPLRSALPRWTGAASQPAMADAVSGLVAAVPFITSLTVLVSILTTALILWLAGALLGAKRGYAHWVGLAAFAAIPGWFRLLLDAVRLYAGHLPADVPALSVLHWVGDPQGWHPYLVELLRSLDPFQVWSTVVLAVGFAVYARRALGTGAAVALAIWALQIALRLGGGEFLS